MPGESISQIPLQALVVNGAMDFLEISQWTGNPSAPYVTKKVVPNLIASAGNFITGTFTLDPNVSSTVVPVSGALPTSVMPAPGPTTPHAAAAMASTSYTMQNNQFTVTHANNSQTDRTFMFMLFIGG